MGIAVHGLYDQTSVRNLIPNIGVSAIVEARHLSHSPRIHEGNATHRKEYVMILVIMRLLFWYC